MADVNIIVPTEDDSIIYACTCTCHTTITPPREPRTTRSAP